MRRQLLAILVLFVLVLTFLFFLQINLLPTQQLRLGFPTKEIFIFNAAFSLILLFTLTFLSKKQSFKDNLGFLYLASVLLKPIVFIVLFKGLFFGEKPITQIEAVSMLLPTLTSLFFEVLYCSKILKHATPKKNITKD